MVLGNVEGRYKKTFQNPKYLSKKAQMRLKMTNFSLDIFFQKCGVRVFKFCLFGKNDAPISGGWGVWNPFSSPNYYSKKAQIWLIMTPRRYSWWFSMTPDDFYLLHFRLWDKNDPPICGERVWNPFPYLKYCSIKTQLWTSIITRSAQTWSKNLVDIGNPYIGNVKTAE